MAFERICETLADLSEIGSVHSFNNKELAGLRMLRIPKFEKYLIFYRPVPEGTEIIRVLHAARDNFIYLWGDSGGEWTGAKSSVGAMGYTPSLFLSLQASKS